MDINAMITKRAKLVDKIMRLQSRIERDTASLAKAKTDLDRLNAHLTQSADLMAAMLDLDPNEVRNKLLQQTGCSVPFHESESVEEADEMIEMIEPENDDAPESPRDNSNGLKINPFESII